MQHICNDCYKKYRIVNFYIYCGMCPDWEVLCFCKKKILCSTLYHIVGWIQGAGNWKKQYPSPFQDCLRHLIPYRQSDRESSSGKLMTLKWSQLNSKWICCIKIPHDATWVLVKWNRDDDKWGDGWQEAGWQTWRTGVTEARGYEKICLFSRAHKRNLFAENWSDMVETVTDVVCAGAWSVSTGLKYALTDTCTQTSWAFSERHTDKICGKKWGGGVIWNLFPIQ